MISALLGVVVWILRVVTFAILIYWVMTLIAPRNELIAKASRYIEPSLAPMRELLYKLIPKSRGLAIDLSPLLLWLVINVLIWIINLLRGILF